MNILKSKWFSVVAVLAVGWMAISFIQIRTHENIVNKEAGDLEDKVSGMEKNNSALERFLGYVSNPLFLQKEARLKLNYKSPDEQVAFVYPDDRSKTSSGSVDFNKQLAKMPNYLKWAYYLLGY